MNMDDFHAIKDIEELADFIIENCENTSIANLKQIILSIQIKELQLNSAITSALFYLKQKMKNEEMKEFYEQYSTQYRKRREWLIKEQERWMKKD